jgi:pimeloyl-ACP methyl ester carboxylesterase
MPNVVVDGTVHLNVRTAGSGPAVVFHPGFGNNLDIWNWVVAELAATHLCVTFDPRGHGLSDKPDSAFTVDELATDVSALISALGLRDVTLVGHSLGAAACLQAVLDHNAGGAVTALGLLGPALPTFLQRPPGGLGVPAEVFSGLQASLAADYVGTIQATMGGFFHRVGGATAAWLGAKCLDLPVHLGTRYFAALAGIDFEARLAQVRVPVLAAWGAHDQLADPRWAAWFDAQHLPGYTTAVLPDSGHGLMVDEPAAVADLLRGLSARAQAAPDSFSPTASR